MKTVYLIGGTMGVGKTSTSQELKKKLKNAVFLDGDWCWDADPFQVTDETKAIVIDNICYLLNNFIHSTAYENIIFCWVMHEQTIIDTIVERLDLADCDLKIISLICSPEALVKRLSRDIEAGLRKADIINRSIVRLPMYEKIETIKIDVTDIDSQIAAEKISAL